MDETNNLFIPDMVQASSFRNLNPINTVISQAEPHKLSGDVGLPKQIWAMLGNWLDEDYQWQV